MMAAGVYRILQSPSSLATVLFFQLAAKPLAQNTSICTTELSLNESVQVPPTSTSYLSVTTSTSSLFCGGCSLVSQVQHSCCGAANTYYNATVTAPLATLTAYVCANVTTSATVTPFSDVRCVPPCSINYNATLISSKGPTHATASKDNFTLQTLSGTFRSGFPTASIAASRGCGLNRTVVSMATAINNGTLHHWFPVQSGQYCEPNRTTVSGGTVTSSGNVSIHWSPVQSGRIRARTITATSYNVVKLTLESVVSSVTTDTPASSAIDGTTETPTSTTTPVVISQRSILNFRYSCPTTAEEVAQCPYLCGDPSSGKFLACSFTDLSFIQSEDGPDTMVCQACMFPLDG